MKIGLILLGMVLLLGCSSKKAKVLMNEYKEKQIYFNTLQKTEKILLLENNITKTVLTATYLRDKYARVSDENNESFIVGLYFEDEEIGDLNKIFGIRSLDDNVSENNKTDEKIEDLDDIFEIKNVDDSMSENNNTKVKVVKKDENNETIITEYALTLNGKKAISIERIDVSDVRLKGLTLLSEWNTYALVTFKYEKKKLLKMTFDSPLYGSASVNFSKVAKYTFSKTAF